MAEEDFDEIYDKYDFGVVQSINKNPPFSLFEVDVYDSEDIPGSKDVELGFEKNVLTLYDVKLFEKVKRGYRKRSFNVLKNASDFIFLGLVYDRNYKVKILDEKKENIYLMDAAALSIDDVIMDLEEFEENIKESDE